MAKLRRITRSLAYWYHYTQVLRSPYVTYNTLHDLPKLPGLYYVVQPLPQHPWCVLYVGLAGEKRSHLYGRWLQYDRHSQLDKVQRGARLYYQVKRNRRSLRYLEAVAIQRLDPVYNKQRPNPRAYRLSALNWLDAVYVTSCAVFLYYLFVS